MIESMQCLSTRSQVTSFEVINDNAIFTTKLHGLKLFSIHECSVQINLSNSNLNLNTTATAISPNGELVAFANKNTIYIIEISSHTILQTIKTQSKNINLLTFDSSSSYLISGDNSGRVIQYKYESSSSLARLCSFPSLTKQQKYQHYNFVSAFATYENLVACSGQGGNIIIVDLHSRANKIIIKETNVHANALCFLNKNTLISADVDGVVHKISLRDTKNHHKINTTIKDIEKIIILENQQYLLISSGENFISLIDIENFKLIHKKYISFSHPIIHMTLYKNNLLVALENLEIHSLELPNKEQLSSLILHNSLDKAYKLIEHSPMLQGTLEHLQLEEHYKKAFSNAVGAILNNQKDFALQIMSTYKNVTSKKDEIEQLFKSFPYYNRFQALVLEKKYSLAYAMCVKYPAFTYTLSYKKMEEAWKKSFSDAQRQMAQGRADLAKAILSEYATTATKRPLIKFVLNHNKRFLEFLKAIEKKEYQKVYVIAKESEIFAQIPKYISFHQEVIQKVAQIKEYIRVGKVQNAQNLLNELQNISHLKHELLLLQKECSSMVKLQKAYRENNFELCYEILDSSKSLEYTQLCQLLEKHWSKLIRKAETFAFAGNLKRVQETFDALITLKTRSDKVGDLLRLSYISRIKGFINTKSFKKAEILIYSYMDIFGKDSEITVVKKLFEHISKIKLAIQEDELIKKPRDNWLSSTLVKH